MRLLHLTDTHLGLAGRADVAARALGWALSPVLAGQVDAVLHTGDLFDRSEPPPAAVELARRALGDVARRVPVAVIAGNHDRKGVEKSLGGVPGIELVDQPRVVRLGELRIGCLPHARLAEAWSAQAAELARQGVDLLACHQSFEGHWVPGYTFRAGGETVGAAGMPGGVRHVLCGHLHPRQATRVGEAIVVCPGSTVRTSSREGPAPKGTAIWTFGRRVDWRSCPLPEVVSEPCPSSPSML